MWLSLNIISDIVDIKDLSAEEIALRLTMSSAEIDGIDYMNHHLYSVITAKVESILPHPNADKLTLVNLETGKEKIRVVCGAPNHKKEDIVALATVGTKFSDKFTVKTTKIRGEKSDGMLCSGKELGLSDDHSGILILPANTPLGTPLSTLFPYWVDTKLEIDNKSITHRPDLWSHTGFAREIASIFGKKCNEIIDYNIPKTFKDIEKLIVTINDPSASPRYCGLIVKNIKISQSPQWLQARVTSIGMRPINNIVDITNYVMAQIGEPMHAFDRKKLNGNEIIVRFASKDESIKTLDDELRTLTPEDIVIADKGGPIALAGIMGGGDSEIDDNTDEIVLEAANFNPVNIRKTANKFNLRSEAAIRFEKSLDPNLCEEAIIRCYDLIKKIIPDAEAITKIVDTYPKKLSEINIDTSTDFIRKKIGTAIDDARITGILTSLNFKVIHNGKNLKIAVPSFRSTKDISIPDDIVEEVGRIYGYDNIEPKAPLLPAIPPERNVKRLLERKIKDILSRNHNMVEVSNYSFIGQDDLFRLQMSDDKELKLMKPLSQEQDRLRRSLIPNLIKNIQLNQKNYNNFNIFELGRVYLKDNRKSPELANENTYVSGVTFSTKSEDLLIYKAKNIVIDLLKQLNLTNVNLIPVQENLPPYVHPGKSIKVMINKTEAGHIFELHPKIIKNFELNGRAAMFDLNVEILHNTKKTQKNFIELPKFPDVPFEISVIADKFTYSEEIISIINNTNKDLIKKLDIISIYEGNPIPEGMKSISIKIVFASRDRTLSPDDINNIQKKIIEKLKSKGFRLR